MSGSPIDPRGIRAALDMTQTEFAARLGVTVRTVTRWEQGGVIPVEGLAALYNVCRGFPARQRYLFAAICLRLKLPAPDLAMAALMDKLRHGTSEDVTT